MEIDQDVNANSKEKKYTVGINKKYEIISALFLTRNIPNLLKKLKIRLHTVNSLWM